MTAAVQARYKAKAGILKALAHPTRLFIVDELAHGERSVRALTDLIGAEMPTVSRHLSVLRNAGILQDEKRGAQVFYRLTPSGDSQRRDCWNNAGRNVRFNLKKHRRTV